jgi:hypothetical protein
MVSTCVFPVTRVFAGSRYSLTKQEVLFVDLYVGHFRKPGRNDAEMCCHFHSRRLLFKVSQPISRE